MRTGVQRFQETDFTVKVFQMILLHEVRPQGHGGGGGAYRPSRVFAGLLPLYSVTLTTAGHGGDALTFCVASVRLVIARF